MHCRVLEVSVLWFEFSWPCKPVERSTKLVEFEPVEKGVPEPINLPWTRKYNLSWFIFPFVRFLGNRYFCRLAFPTVTWHLRRDPPNQEQEHGSVRYINILTWHRSFRDKLLCLVVFSLYSNLFLELEDKGNLKYLQFLPESLRFMLEYWYIERGLLQIKLIHIWLCPHIVRSKHVFNYWY